MRFIEHQGGRGIYVQRQNVPQHRETLRGAARIARDAHSVQRGASLSKN